jgi:glycosyltransferase involved in cell wall biosynthesis
VKPGVSFVVPVYNGERFLAQTLDAILAQRDGDRPVELIAVEDGSTDGSAKILERYARDGRLQLVRGPRRGAAAAINAGVRQAQHPIIAQVDQDVVLEPAWMARLAAALDAPDVAAAQGYYTTDRGSSLWARAMGLDLEQRYARIRDPFVDHVCTGNSAYRRQALLDVGLFDEQLGYGYDNDMSYRLGAAGWRLVFCRDARSLHHWKTGALGYLKQQYGQGYGRLDLIFKHRRRYHGDDVSGPWMILHAPLMLAALAALALALVLAFVGGPWRAAVFGAAAVTALLAGERLAAGVQAARQFGDAAGLYFVPAHLLRDVAWVGALLLWSARRLLGQPTRPTDSM